MVLATSIAETSLTIEGVRVVIDSGLSRVPRYEPDVGLTRLETVRVSRAAADQRRGRAGRTEPGVCYRLWDEPQTGSLEAYTRPEILSADLSSFVLDLAQWGVSDPSTLSFLDPPPQAALNEARALLRELGAIDADGRITDEGRKLRELPLPPRLARMVVDAAREGAGLLAADIAAVLTERGLGGDDVDLRHRLDQFRRDRSRRAEDARAMAKRWASLPSPSPEAGGSAGEAGRGGVNGSATSPLAVDLPRRGRLQAYVHPRSRLSRPHCQKPWRRGGRLPARQWPRRQCRSGVGAGARAVPGGGGIDRRRGGEPHRAGRRHHARRNRSALCRPDRRPRNRDLRQRLRLLARAAQRAGSARWRWPNRRKPVTPDADTAHILAQGIVGLGLDRLPWSKAALQFRQRVGFLRRAEGDEWPDLSDEGLAQSAADWLEPLLLDKTALQRSSPPANSPTRS